VASTDSASRDQSGRDQSGSDKAGKTTTPTRNASQLEADVTATRHRLAASVEALIDEVHPNRIKQRQVDKVKRFADTEIETAKALIFNARGDLRTDRVVLLGAAVVGGIAFMLIIRSLARRGRGG
jgi:hypothetical protein